MFTGIVEETGSVQSITPCIDGIRVEFYAKKVLEDVKIGDSVSVNGCCLTIIAFTPTTFTCHLVNETLQVTCFNELQLHEKVNLERAICLKDRLGGHLVQGHVDGIGKIIEKKALQDGSWWVTVESPSTILRYLIYKGSVAVDGISLTIAEISSSHFSFAMIPHTAEVTNLGVKNRGSLVNLEVDVLAKYIERLLPTQFAQGK